MPAPVTLPAEVSVYGGVLSPAPLIDLVRQAAAARMAIEATRVSLDRSNRLFSSGELVARKDIEALQVQLKKDEAALRSLEDRLVLEWGGWMAVKSPQDRDAMVGELLAGRQSLLRLTIPRTASPSKAPVATRLHPVGMESRVLQTKRLFPAPSVDPAFQSQAYIGILETGDSPLAIGLSLEGWARIDGPSRQGLLIPGEAVVFHMGKAWVYQKEPGHDFRKTEVPMDTPVQGGWFVADGVLKPVDTVIRGAQWLLSKEVIGEAGVE